MGIKKGIAWSIAGIVALEYAAYESGHPGLGDLIRSYASSSSIGEIVDTMVRYGWDYYGRDFFYDKFAALGTAGQCMMYGGLGNIVRNLFKKQEKPAEEKD